MRWSLSGVEVIAYFAVLELFVNNVVKTPTKCLPIYN